MLAELLSVVKVAGETMLKLIPLSALSLRFSPTGLPATPVVRGGASARSSPTFAIGF
jgi:hypothetical protein